MDQQDIDIIEAFQRLGHALRRTGTVIIALGLTAGIGTVFDLGRSRTLRLEQLRYLGAVTEVTE